MGGGPSHMDLWDLKPGEQTGGEFKPIKTTASGVEISEVLPTVASQFKHLIAVRSLVTNEGSHERGTVLMNTGRQPNPVVQYPAIGSVLSNQITPKELPLPGFIGIGGTAQRIGPGFLGMNSAPFTVQNAGQPPENIKAPSSLGNEMESNERLRRRQRLFYSVEDSFAENGFPHLKKPEDREAAGSSAQAHTAIYKKAFDLTVSPLRSVFEISKESTSVIDAYGGRMNKRGIILISTLFGLFALSFGVLGVRALTLGPDPAQPTEAQLAARTVAADQLERQIAAARAEAPPALPAVPKRIAAATTGGGAAQATRQAPMQAQAPTYYEEGEEYEEYEEEEGKEYEEEHEDDYEHEYGGEHDDD